MTETPTLAPRPRRFSWKAGLVLALVLAFLALLGWQTVRVNRGLRVGDPLPPDLTLTTFDGSIYRLGDLKGTVVLINFWASWCDPCAEEAPHLEQAWQRLKDRGDVLFLGLAWTDTDEKSRAYLQRFGITYPNGPDLGTRWAQTFRIRGVPETYIVDKQGRLAYIKIGPFTSAEEIVQAVLKVLGE